MQSGNKSLFRQGRKKSPFTPLHRPPCLCLASCTIMRKSFVPLLQVPISIMVSERHSSISQDMSNIHKMYPQRLSSFIVDITCQCEALLPKNRSRNIKAPSSAGNIWSHLHLLILEQSQEERAGFSSLKANIYLSA